MKLLTSYSATFFLYILFIPTYIFSQSELLNEQYYNSFDSFTTYYNIEVFNGKEHIDIYSEFKKGNHKFYHSDDFLLGSVFYNDQPYYDLNMKYDLLNDFLLLGYKNQKISYLRLNEDFVHEFSLDGDKFVRLLENPQLDGFYRNGFFKEVYKGNNYMFYIKYLKSKTSRSRDKKIYYVFDDQSIYILFYKNYYFRINKIKDVIKILPQNKDQIQKFYTNYRKLYKKDREQFLEKLFKNLENLGAFNIN